ncbi:MAG: GNAT family N-acetyltransferase [Ruminococcaceae bacterium]|nr:GNAT family N-acetyltransferase [Oscillospiraceae bacterium]
MTYRKAGLQDVETLMQLRKTQLIDEAIAPNCNIDAELRAFFIETLGNGSMVEWAAEDGGEIVATAAVVFYQFPPTYTNKSGKKGYVTNMYTRPSHRKQGLASVLLGKLVAEAKQAGITRLWLGASKMGRPVYEKFGFADSPNWLEMDL